MDYEQVLRGEICHVILLYDTNTPARGRFRAARWQRRGRPLRNWKLALIDSQLPV